MIHKIEIENFYSIRNRQVLDLRVPANASRDDHRLASCWLGSSERAPKVVAVFGANGSGKSNLLRAVSFAVWFVGRSFDLGHNARIPFEPFNDEQSLKSPTRLRVWLSWLENLGELGNDGAPECPYCYELAIENGEHPSVIGEGIFCWPSSTRRRTRLIERFEDGSVKASRAFGPSKHIGALDSILRPNASVISTLAQLNHPIAKVIVDAAQVTPFNILVEKGEISEDRTLSSYASNPDLVERFNREVSRIDVGTRALEIRHGSGDPEMWFRHDNLLRLMPFKLESRGTQEFLKLFPLITFTLETGGIMIIDELDSALHPTLLEEVVDWFHDPDRNPKNAQLWMSCHNASLLEELSKDEIVLCEKNWHGRTRIYSLNDIKGVRRDDNYYRKYRGGVYGAVPHIG